MIDLGQLERSQQVVAAPMPPTTALAWPLLAQRLGADVIVKHENHTPIGAFKVRGGLVYVERLQRERPQASGIISATRGNHGQSLAFAARRFGVPATIYVPSGNSVEKNQSMRALGANTVFVQVYGDSMALFDSSIAPASPLLTGGGDPLAAAVDEGRRRGVEVHAWMNVLNVYSGGLGAPSDASVRPALGGTMVGSTTSPGFTNP